MNASSRWLGEWHRPDDAIHARLTRQGNPDPVHSWPVNVDGQLWLFSSSVWLLDPLGLDVGPGLDAGLLAFAVERRRPLLEQIGMQHLTLAQTTVALASGSAGSEWLHLDLRISAAWSGDDTPLSLTAWVAAESLPDWLARTGLIRRLQQDDAWAAQVPIPLRWSLPPFSLPAGLLRSLVSGSLIRLPFEANLGSFCRLEGCGLWIDLRPSDDATGWVVLQGVQGRPDFATIHKSGTDMITEDTAASGDDADDSLDADMPQCSGGTDPATDPSTEMPAEPGAALTLDDLSIPLTVLCGRVELPLQELRAWGPGSEVDLPTEALDEIELCSGTRVLARGRLIRLNDRLAVRITGVMP